LNLNPYLQKPAQKLEAKTQSQSPRTHVISTEGGALAGVVERPLYFVFAAAY
jgi:hypothetical protein